MKTEVLDTESFDYFLIVDLESTCCNNGSISKGEHEIIEIGAVMVDAITLKEIDSFNTFVKPIKHSKLTQFCTTLTLSLRKMSTQLPSSQMPQNCLSDGLIITTTICFAVGEITTKIISNLTLCFIKSRILLQDLTLILKNVFPNNKK